MRLGFVGNQFKGELGSPGNTGNFIHGFAARRFLKSSSSSEIELNPSPKNVDYVRSTCDHLVVVAANSLRASNSDPNPKLARDTEFYKKVGLPVTVLGLGCQAPLNQKPSDLTLNRDTIAWLEVLQDLGPSIGVRGEYTAEVLKHYGFDNVDVIGCQSTFFSRDKDFKFPKLNQSVSSTRKMINLTNLKEERALLKYALLNDWGYIGQYSLFEYMLKEADLDLNVSFSAIEKDLRRLAPSELIWLMRWRAINFRDYHSWIKRRFYQFYDVPTWQDHIRREYDLAFGTRLHGNMAAVQSGIPAVWLVHDARTKELSEYHGLPNIPLDRFKRPHLYTEQIEQALSSSNFDKVYPKNFHRFCSFLEKHKLSF